MRVKAQEKYTRAIDAKAGLLLGFDGLVVGFIAQAADPGNLALAAQAAAALSGLIAAVVLFFLRGSRVTEGPRELRDLADKDPDDALLLIIDTTVGAYQLDELDVGLKSLLLGWSALFLSVGLGLLVSVTALKL
jgi:hypothetical protein